MHVRFGTNSSQRTANLPKCFEEIIMRFVCQVNPVKSGMFGVVLDTFRHERVQARFAIERFSFADNTFSISGKLVKRLIAYDVFLNTRFVNDVHHLFTSGRFPVLTVIGRDTARHNEIEPYVFIFLHPFYRFHRPERHTYDVVPLFTARKRIGV